MFQKKLLNHADGGWDKRSNRWREPYKSSWSGDPYRDSLSGVSTPPTLVLSLLAKTRTGERNLKELGLSWRLVGVVGVNLRFVKMFSSL